MAQSEQEASIKTYFGKKVVAEEQTRDPERARALIKDGYMLVSSGGFVHPENPEPSYVLCKFE